MVPAWQRGHAHTSTTRLGEPIEHSGIPAALGWTLTFARSQLRSEEHTSELQSRLHLVCRLLLEKTNMTTWTAPDSATGNGRAGYVLRLLEVAGLADVAVYVASDERYNDDVTTQFLRLLLEAAKP